MSNLYQSLFEHYPNVSTTESTTGSTTEQLSFTNITIPYEDILWQPMSTNIWASSTSKYKPPTPVLIKTIGRKTFVTWDDNTTTKVVCEQNTTPDPFMAFCAAFTKKVIGNTSSILKVIKEADEKEQRKRMKEARRKAAEYKQKKEKEQFQKDVEAERYRLAVQRAAERKLNNKQDTVKDINLI